ncbi:MAG: efflux RND transporter periplasmic adaptor subunit [Pseudomonadota bacterium]
MTSEQTTAANRNRPTLMKRIIGRAAAVLVTGTFFAVAGGIIWQTTGLIGERAQAVEKPQATEPMFVETARIETVSFYTVDRAFSGQIEAPQQADLSFEQGGTVQLISVDEGEYVAVGDVIARLDDRILKAELERLNASMAAVEAQRELLSLDNERASELNKRGFAANQAVDRTRLGLVELDARMAEIDAGIMSVNIQLEKMTITAPFDGIVSQRRVDPGTTIGGGQPIMSLIEDAKPVFRVGIDPQLAASLNVGETVNVTFGSDEVDAQIISFLPQLDPTTRTQTIRAQLVADTEIAIGQTGTLTLEERIETAGAWIPLSAIEDGVRGLWTIKTVQGDSEQTVGIEAVELIHVDEENAYVRGSFASDSDLITNGLHRVVAGQAIRTQSK